MDTFLNSVIQGILLGGVYCLVAAGIVLVYKATKVLNLAYGETMVLLAYIAWYLMADLGLPVAAAIPLVILSGMLVNLVIDRFVLRPLIGRPFLAMVIATLILGLCIRGVVILVWGGMTEFLPPFIPSGSLNIGGISISYGPLWCFVIAMFMFVLIILYFRYTDTGLVMRAVGEDHHVSASLGVSVKRVFTVSWLIAGIAAAVGGILLGRLYVVDPALGNVGVGRALPALLVGGLESIPGALVGGLLVGTTEAMAATYVDPLIGGGFREAMPLLIMVIVLMVRPQGLFGVKEVGRI